MRNEDRQDEPRAGRPEWQPLPEPGSRPAGSAWDINAFLESFLTLGVRRGGKGHRADAAMTEYLKENEEHWPDAPYLFRQARFFLALQDAGHSPAYVPGPPRGFHCDLCDRSAARRGLRRSGDLAPGAPCAPAP